MDRFQLLHSELIDFEEREQHALVKADKKLDSDFIIYRKLQKPKLNVSLTSTAKTSL
jgi:hypothetical protein